MARVTYAQSLGGTRWHIIPEGANRALCGRRVQRVLGSTPRPVRRDICRDCLRKSERIARRRAASGDEFNELNPVSGVLEPKNEGFMDRPINTSLRVCLLTLMRFHPIVDYAGERVIALDQWRSDGLIARQPGIAEMPDYQTALMGVMFQTRYREEYRDYGMVAVRIDPEEDGIIRRIIIEAY